MYLICFHYGKKRYHKEDFVNTRKEAIEIMQSYFEIDKAAGMNPEWISEYTFHSTYTLPNGREVKVSTFRKWVGDGI